MISLFGLNIYLLLDDQMIKWLVFMILLLVVSFVFIRIVFRFGLISGWVVLVVMILFYVVLFIDLIMLNFIFEDLVLKVYIDIQYGIGYLFIMGIMVLLIIMVIVVVLLLIIWMMVEYIVESDEMYEV